MREGGSRVNPFSLSFAPFKWSQETGSYIESSQRFQLFLHELKKMGGGTNRQLWAHEIEAAKFEAKKWMLDYSDLTDFERSWMRGTFPFYCVPDDTEILTRDGWITRSCLKVGEEVLTLSLIHISEPTRPY